MLQRASLPLLALLLGSCQSLHFPRAELVSATLDPELGATKVTVEFEVLDGAQLPVSDLDSGDFSIFENGVPVGSEAMATTRRELHSIDVAILLDRSASMYRTGRIAEVLKTAARLAEGLAGNPCTVRYYGFARTVEPVQSLAAVAAGGETKVQHWTALYRALGEILDRHPEGIVVVLTDGADNYSHNLQAPTLAELAARINKERRIVHAIGFGAIAKEFDYDGVSGASALRRLTEYGSYGEVPEDSQEKAAEAVEASAGGAAGGESIVEGVVTEVLRRIPTTYTIEYYSPNLGGENTLRIDVTRKGVHGSSEVIRYVGAGPGREGN